MFWKAYLLNYLPQKNFQDLFLPIIQHSYTVFVFILLNYENSICLVKNTEIIYIYMERGDISGLWFILPDICLSIYISFIWDMTHTLEKLLLLMYQIVLLVGIYSELFHSQIQDSILWCECAIN